MNLFSRFKKNKDSKAKEDYEKALVSFNEGSYQEALGVLSWGFRKDVEYKPLYQLAADCLNKLGAGDEANMFKNAKNNLNKFESFNDLGTHFFNVGHYDLAIPFFEKAVEIDSSNNNTIHDLAIVYSRRFQIEKAIQVLEKNNPQSDFWNYWFWLKLRILSGDTKEVDEGLNELTKYLDIHENQEEIEFPRQKVEEVKEMLKRFENLKDIRTHIQDWHFIQYGGVILDFFEDSEEYVAGGRYVAAWGSNYSIKKIINRLKIYLDAFGLKFESVRYLNERNSKIIGLAIGKELQLPCQEYKPNSDSKNYLIVAANSSDLDDYPELSEVKENQLVFALNHTWLSPSVIAPDIVGLMTQQYYLPWNGGGFTIVDSEAKKTEPDTRVESEIAKDIFNETVEQKLSEERLNFYLDNREFLKAIGSEVNNSRFNFMIESPVPGSYFG